jgi:hypothetical protein
MFLSLFSESPKFTHFVNKVSEIVLRIKDDEILSEVLITLSTLREFSSEEKTSLINKTLAWILTEYPNDIKKYQELYEDVLASVIKATDLVNRQEYYRKYLKILYKSNKYIILLTAAEDMHTQFPQDTQPLGNHICPFFLNSHYYIFV